MSVAYLTHDEVNAAIATRIAGRHELELSVFDLRESHHAAEADLLVLDLDHLPTECKVRLLARTSGSDLAGVGVHSYQLTAGEVRALRAAGAFVARRLTAAVLLRERATTRPAAVREFAGR